MGDGMSQSTDDDFSIVRNAGLKGGMNHGISSEQLVLDRSDWIVCLDVCFRWRLLRLR